MAAPLKAKLAKAGFQVESPFLEHPKARVRKEAKKALKKIDKK